MTGMPSDARCPSIRFSIGVQSTLGVTGLVARGVSLLLGRDVSPRVGGGKEACGRADPRCGCYRERQAVDDLMGDADWFDRSDGAWVHPRGRPSREFATLLRKPYLTELPHCTWKCQPLCTTRQVFPNA